MLEEKGDNLAEVFLWQAAQAPFREAIVCGEKSMSYHALAFQVTSCAAAFKRIGIGGGDHCAVFLPNSIEYIVLLLAASKVGLVLVPLDKSLPPSAAARAMVASDVNCIVGTKTYFEEIGCGLNVESGWASGPWCIFHDRGLVQYKPAEPDAPRPLSVRGKWEDLFILTLTSGSTGEPKPIMLTQEIKRRRAERAIELYDVTQEDRILAATPLYHSLAERLVLMPLLCGGTSILMPTFTSALWLRTANEQKVTFTIAVSSQLKSIAKELDACSLDTPETFRSLVSSSALLDNDTKMLLQQRFGCEIHECYGTSEVAIVTDINFRTKPCKLGSVGQPVPGVEVVIVDSQLNSVGIGVEGEIICKTPMFCGGYYKRPDLMMDSLVNGFFRTGDFGYIDADNYLYFRGRKKEIIITGGINIYPADIEAVVSQHASVAESAAISVTDDYLGEVVGVAVVPRHTEGFDLRSLRLFCAKRLTDSQQPRKWFVLRELPKNAMGKVLKREIIKKCIAP